MLINAYCTHRKPPPLTFPHELNARRDRADPALQEHLEGFAAFVAGDREELSATRFHVIGHILRVHHHFSFTLDEGDMDAYTAWATEANAISFLPDGTVRDPHGAVLAYPGEVEPDPEARLPFPLDAQARRAASVRRLEALGVPVHETLPPVISEVEVDLRQPVGVARRALALFAVALRAESLASGEAIPVTELRRRSPGSFVSLSPTEQAFLDDDAPPEQTVIDSAWRYEALFLFQWALGMCDELHLPTQICDVPSVARAMLDSGSELHTAATLRPTSEILDALDLHYRLHWAVRQALIEEREMPAELDPGVIAERHSALNWIVRFQDADWDDVTTPT